MMLSRAKRKKLMSLWKFPRAQKMKMIDGGEPDDKIIAVPIDDPRWQLVKDLPDINPHTIKEIGHFFSTYKKLQNKEVQVTGFENRVAADKKIQPPKGS